MKTLDQIRRIIEKYPPEFRRWCYAVENGGCACAGCVRWPPPSEGWGDPEGKPFRNPEDRLTREEMELYERSLRN